MVRADARHDRIEVAGTSIDRAPPLAGGYWVRSQSVRVTFAMPATVLL